MSDKSAYGFQATAGPPRTNYNKNQHAQRLFDGIASRYDLLAEALSFCQTGVWRRFLVSRLDVGPGATVLDICTGTGAMALGIARKTEAKVVGVDLSEQMLYKGRQNVSDAGLQDTVTLLRCRAESLGFGNDSFDAVCFTWLLRYVEDPPATIAEAVRVLKPGGRLVSLEFGVPTNVVARSLWSLYTKLALPLATGAISSGWRDLGKFLGPSIDSFDRAYSDEDISKIWVDLGISDVQVKRLSLGGGVVMWGTKKAAATASHRNDGDDPSPNMG